MQKAGKKCLLALLKSQPFSFLVSLSPLVMMFLVLKHLIDMFYCDKIYTEVTILTLFKRIVQWL